MTTTTSRDRMTTDKAALIARAWEMRMAGESMYAIAVALGVSKEWLRAYAGMADGRRR